MLISWRCTAKPRLPIRAHPDVWLAGPRDAEREFEKGVPMSLANASIQSGRKGDVIVIAGRHVGAAARSGEILEVLGAPGHVRYRVRWDDGGESVFYPGSDASIRPAHQGRRRGGSR